MGRREYVLPTRFKEFNQRLNCHVHTSRISSEMEKHVQNKNFLGCQNVGLNELGNWPARPQTGFTTAQCSSAVTRSVILSLIVTVAADTIVQFNFF